MDKFAQDRKWYNKLHEWGNVSGKAAEKFFNPEFLKVMTALRKIDNNIRSIAAGESLGVEKDPLIDKEVPGDAGKDHISLKELTKSAQSNLNRREYMQAASDLGRFHAKLAEINKEIDSLDANVDAVHHQFLFKHLTDGNEKETQEEVKKRLEQVEHLKALQERMSKSSGKNANSLVKEADIMDFFVNLTKPRGKALAAWEKRYPDKYKALKIETGRQIVSAVKILDTVIAELKVMAGLRASRKPDDYLKEAAKIQKAYVAYDASFKEYYKTHINDFLIKMFPKDSVAPAAPAGESKKSNEQVMSEIEKEHGLDGKGLSMPPMPAAPPGLTGPPAPRPAQQSLSMPPAADSIPAGPPSGMESNPPSQPPPSGGGAAAPAPAPRLPTMMPPPMPSAVVPAADNQLFDPTLHRLMPPAANDNSRANDAVAHRKFYASLEAMSSESPYILSAYISKYARSIQYTDPTTAINLLKIATRIKG